MDAVTFVDLIWRDNWNFAGLFLLRWWLQSCPPWFLSPVGTLYGSTKALDHSSEHWCVWHSSCREWIHDAMKLVVSRCLFVTWCPVIIQWKIKAIHNFHYFEMLHDKRWYMYCLELWYFPRIRIVVPKLKASVKVDYITRKTHSDGISCLPYCLRGHTELCIFLLHQLLWQRAIPSHVCGLLGGGYQQLHASGVQRRAQPRPALSACVSYRVPQCQGTISNHEILKN